MAKQTSRPITVVSELTIFFTDRASPELPSKLLNAFSQHGARQREGHVYVPAPVNEYNLSPEFVIGVLDKGGRFTGPLGGYLNKTPEREKRLAAVYAANNSNSGGFSYAP